MPGIAGVTLRLADDVMGLVQLAGRELGDPDPPLPFWAFAWAGGLAISRHLLEHPGIVAGRRVVDIATGSGLCAIVAARLGAASVLAADIDPLAVAAATLNARANDVRVVVTGRDLLAEPPPGCDVVLAGDVCYEERMAERMLAWLRAARGAGAEVLIGDPGRRFLPAGLEHVATYRVLTSREIEDAETKDAAVYALDGG